MWQHHARMSFSWKTRMVKNWPSEKKDKGSIQRMCVGTRNHFGEAEIFQYCLLLLVARNVLRLCPPGNKFLLLRLPRHQTNRHSNLTTNYFYHSLPLSPSSGHSGGSPKGNKKLEFLHNSSVMCNFSDNISPTRRLRWITVLVNGEIPFSIHLKTGKNNYGLSKTTSSTSCLFLQYNLLGESNSKY